MIELKWGWDGACAKCHDYKPAVCGPNGCGRCDGCVKTDGHAKGCGRDQPPVVDPLRQANEQARKDLSLLLNRRRA